MTFQVFYDLYSPMLARVASRIVSTSKVLAEELGSCGACFLRQSLEIDVLTANTLTRTNNSASYTG